MDKILRIAFEAAGAAVAGIVVDQVRKQVQKHGPHVIDAAAEKVPEIAAKVKSAADRIRNKFKPKN